MTAVAGLAVITGASSGIGLATALLLHQQGWNVVALGRRETAPEQFSGLPRLRYGSADLIREEPAAALQRIAPDALARVGVLVNCAGHDTGGAVPFHEHEDARWRSVLRLNVEATMSLTHACLPAMLAAGRGDIVMIGSITARRTPAGLAAYTTTKHAIRGFVQALRADYSASGVRISEIAPGVVRTGFAATRWGGDSERARQFYAGFPECLEPEDIARAIGYVVSQPPHVSVTEMVLLPSRERA